MRIAIAASDLETRVHAMALLEIHVHARIVRVTSDLETLHLETPSVRRVIALRARVLVTASSVKTVAAKVWGEYDVLLADLDGVVYEGAAAIKDAPEAILALQNLGLPVGYVTNNSSRKPETIAAQLAGFGVACAPEDIIGSGKTGVDILKTMIPAGSKVLVVGGEGLRARVVEGGFELAADSGANPDAVIQGFAPDVSWRDLAEAAFSIQNGAKWVATNQDWTLPQEKGLAPGNGTLVSAVHTAVGQLPVVAGKPEPAIFHTAVEHFGAKKALFIGDRIDTDITGANRANLDSVLVLTGVSTRKEVLGIKPEGRPTYIIGSMAELLKPYKAPKKTKRGFACDGAEVERLGNKVVVTIGDPKSLGALRAACAVIYGSELPIYALDVEAALYE
ncbi:MAG: HAD-IIA family hydrolase [Rhodoluna sp.]